jgi:Tfp pilus assembly protein PilO
LDSATTKLQHYRSVVAEAPELKKQVSKFEISGGEVPAEEQGVNLMTKIQQQAAQSNVQIQNFGRIMSHTNDAFYVEQILSINVLATESNLVDFVYNLGTGPSMIRVRDLSLQPDPPHQRLLADIKLVASYRKTTAAPAAKNATTAKSK